MFYGDESISDPQSIVDTFAMHFSEVYRTYDINIPLIFDHNVSITNSYIHDINRDWVLKKMKLFPNKLTA